MKIGVISDIHDHRENLQKILPQLQNTEAMICCGDLCSPFIVKDLAENYTNPIHTVFGNNDGDLFRIAKVANGFSHFHLHGEIADLTFDGKRIIVTHFDNIGKLLATSSEFDLVCHGHNHVLEWDTSGKTNRLNPGEVMGGLSKKVSAAIYDTATNSVEFIEV